MLTRTPHRLALVGVALAGLLGVVAVRTRTPAGVPDPWLTAEPKAGGWHDPADGTRWEEERRRVGVELAGRPARGPIRCRLRVAAGAADRPMLEASASNPSAAPVAVRGGPGLLDHITFVLHGPGDEAVSSFCYALVRSPVSQEEPPPLVIAPGADVAENPHLSVAADHGHRPLVPGRYCVEAVFAGLGLPGGDPLLARSGRVPIRVGE